MRELDAVEGLVERGVGFATEGVADAGGGHEVALVGGVDEDAAPVGFARERAERGDAATRLLDAAGAVEPFVPLDDELEILHVAFEHRLGD